MKNAALPASPAIWAVLTPPPAGTGAPSAGSSAAPAPSSPSSSSSSSSRRSSKKPEMPPTTRYVIRPPTPDSRTVAALSMVPWPSCTGTAVATVVPAMTRATIATATESMSSLPSLASGFSSQDSQVMSRSSKMKSRKIISRNMPPKAAIAGWALVTSVS